MPSSADAARRICRSLSDEGFRALLAGGCVRDMILGSEPNDYDIATDARPADVMRLFEHTVPVGEAFGVVLVLLPEGQFEVATFRGDGPYEDGRHPAHVDFTDERHDALRRDFTINALFHDPLTGQTVDYVNGQEDIRAGVIRAVGDPAERFAEDHLRLLRAIRFAARLGYVIEPGTYAALKDLAPSIRRTSAERIRDELLKMLTEGAARRAFELLHEAGLLEVLLPEVARMKGVPQPPQFHPEGDVWTHTLLMLDEMRNATPVLALAVLLHDVGKPETMTESDRIRFNSHDKVGADTARAICRRLRMSSADTDAVAWLVDNHMRLSHAPDMRESRRKRFVRMPGFRDLVELCRLDCLASHGDMALVNWANEYRDGLGPEQIRPAPLLTGSDLIAMGYKPGPLFGEILTAVEDAQLEGVVATREQAEAFVSAQWPIR